MSLLTLGVAACLVGGCLACAAACNGDGQHTQSEAELEARRRQMVDSQIRARGVRDPRVLAALEQVPRHRFVPPSELGTAYGDHPLAIGQGQTISQPYIVAYMSEALALDATDRVLEVGTGSGYQAAVLGELVAEVYTVEIVAELAQRAASVLRDLGYSNVHVREGDGYAGWPEHAPFDAVIVTAAPDHIPQPLVDQLAIGGRLVVPVGTNDQYLLVLTRTVDGLREESRLPVRFVPLTRRK
ncbi:MAG: protein-L-isoaspartate(D-aspartate) O-methyltransferase [Vicinamibacterales bacterium]